ncbi:MAG: hypothetical protein K6D97_00655 [Clostridia bacterium]|nr:hypothetical protein [Clostridia bacterium]
MQDDEKRNQYIKIIALLIIIILILFFFSRFSRINNYPLPTGNIDVFDIDIDVGYANVSVDNNKSIASGSGKQTKTVVGQTSDNNADIQRVIPTFNESTDSKTLGRVFVDDKNGDYLYQQKLEIFNNAAFQYTNKVAPGVSNTYHFVVHNSSNMNLKYYLEMYEESEYQVNMKYRLKRNNNYVIGDDDTWVTAGELKTAFSNIEKSSLDSYSLDWKWFDHDNAKDTVAGENMTSLYKLNTRFHFEAIDA